jgi:hypothetical protein
MSTAQAPDYPKDFHRRIFGRALDFSVSWALSISRGSNFRAVPDPQHALHDAWRQFIRPAQLNGVILFLDDLHNLVSPSAEGIALTLRDQFQEFALQGLNYSLCFSARADYFSEIRAFAEPAARFYDKIYLASFTSPAETQEYAAAVFGDSAPIYQVSEWLYGKTLGHLYFLAFVSRQLLTLAQGTLSDLELFWPVIFRPLEHEKFRSDLANITEKESSALERRGLFPEE